MAGTVAFSGGAANREAHTSFAVRRRSASRLPYPGEVNVNGEGNRGLQPVMKDAGWCV